MARRLTTRDFTFVFSSFPSIHVLPPPHLFPSSLPTTAFLAFLVGPPASSSSRASSKLPLLFTQTPPGGTGVFGGNKPMERAGNVSPEKKRVVGPLKLRRPSQSNFSLRKHFKRLKMRVEASFLLRPCLYP
jgi:hypothetical protein